MKNFSIPSGIIGGLCALLVCVVLSLSFLSMAIMSERDIHGYVRVPHLVGTEYAELDSLGLDTSVYEIKTTYTKNDEKSGEVLSQNPKGSKIVKLKKGQRCEILLNVAYLPTPSELPNVIAMTSDDAVSFLEGYGYSVALEKSEHEYIQKDRVFEAKQNGNEVTLFISDGYKK